MKKLAILSTLVMSTSVFAGTVTHTNHSSMTVDGFDSKTAAYEAGFDLADNLNEASQSELKFKLPIVDDGVRNIVINETEVQIEEYALERGQMLYKAVVDVDYQYKAHESNND